jgi:protein SCO1/2
MRQMVVTGRLRSATTALALVALAAVAGWGCGAGAESAADRVRESGFRGVVLERPTPKADFTLNDTRGEPFHFAAETEGYITLLFFGYTSCPDICPVHLANLAAVLKELPWEVRSRVKVVFVTTDPERDTPTRIRAWLDAFDPSFIGLTGSRDEVNQIQGSFGLPPAVVQGGTATDYIIGHASQILAFGVDDTARVAYPFGTRQADWAHDLPRLVRQGPALELSAAVVAAPVGGGNVTALYLTISNRGDAADELLAINTTAAESTELHRQVDHGGITTMEETASLPIPAAGHLALEPGGYHAMLIGLKDHLAPGDSIPFELTFRRAGTIRHRATVRSYAELESALDQAAAQTANHGGH